MSDPETWRREHLTQPTDPTTHPVVAFMASDVVLVTRLLVEHVSDRSGRCRVCGDQVRGVRPEWPCPLRVFAAEAWEQVPASVKAAYALGMVRPTHPRPTR